MKRWLALILLIPALSLGQTTNDYSVYSDGTNLWSGSGGSWAAFARVTDLFEPQEITLAGEDIEIDITTNNTYYAVTNLSIVRQLGTLIAHTNGQVTLPIGEWDVTYSVSFDSDSVPTHIVHADVFTNDVEIMPSAFERTINGANTVGDAGALTGFRAATNGYKADIRFTSNTQTPTLMARHIQVRYEKKGN